jgi:hypothetical protein
VPDVNKADFVLPGAQRLHHAVDPVSGQTKDDFYTPIDQALDEHVGRIHGYSNPFMGRLSGYDNWYLCWRSLTYLDAKWRTRCLLKSQSLG